MKYKVELYIGGTMRTGLVTKTHLYMCEVIVNKYYQSFTTDTVRGTWNNKEIGTIKVTIFTDKILPVNALARDLMKELKQKEILVDVEPSNYYIVGE